MKLLYKVNMNSRRNVIKWSDSYAIFLSVIKKTVSY